MTVSLIRGQNIETPPDATKINVELGWRALADADVEFDLNASAFLLNSFHRVRSDADFVFYGQPKSQLGSVVHMSGGRVGRSENEAGGAETFCVDLAALPQDVERIAFVVSIYGAQERGQNFGAVDSAYIRLVNADTGEELVRFDLTEDAGGSQAAIFGELSRRDGEWVFRALGTGLDYGLGTVARNYGVERD
ncbi:MAG: TerD family protein [Thermoguttaceae bacterium]|nr:TerD family protein [Thermoguttaceae bacterium]